MLSPTGIPLFTSPASRREGEGGNKKITTIRLLSFSHHAATKRKCNWRGHSFSSLQFHASPSHGTPLLFLFSLPLFGEKRRKRLFPFLRQASAELSIGGAASIYPPFSAFSSLSLSLSPLFLSFLSFRRHHVKGGRERKGRVRDFPVCPMQCTVLHHSMEGGAGRRERRWYY